MKNATARRVTRIAVSVDLHALRLGGAVMLAGAVILPALPGPDGVPCPLRTLTGIPCPFCGVTTSVIAAVHLRPLQAVAASPAGVLAALLAVWLLLYRDRKSLDVPIWAVALGLASLWLWQLARFDVI